jgi:hypothetical protein
MCSRLVWYIYVTTIGFCTLKMEAVYTSEIIKLFRFILPPYSLIWTYKTVKLTLFVDRQRWRDLRKCICYFRRSWYHKARRRLGNVARTWQNSGQRRHTKLASPTAEFWAWRRAWIFVSSEWRIIQWTIALAQIVTRVRTFRVLFKHIFSSATLPSLNPWIKICSYSYLPPPYLWPSDLRLFSATIMSMVMRSAVILKGHHLRRLLLSARTLAMAMRFAVILICHYYVYGNIFCGYSYLPSLRLWLFWSTTTVYSNMFCDYSNLPPLCP